MLTIINYIFFLSLSLMSKNNSYTRKIQKTGGSTHILALPAEWIRKSELDKGDVIKIFPQPDGNLLLKPLSDKDSKQGKETEIDISKVVDINLVMRLVLSRYLSGFQMIRIYDNEGIDLEVRSQVGQLVANLMGVEIIDESDHWLVLKDLSSLQSLDLNQLIRRTHVLADKMFASSIEAFLSCNKENAELIKIQEPSVDRLYYLVSRQLNAVLSDFSYCSFLGLKMIEVLDYNLIIKRLEAIADHAYGAAQMTLELTEKIEDKKAIKYISDLSKKVRNRYNQAMNCFFNRKVIEANEIANEKADFHKDVQSHYRYILSLDTEVAVRLILLLRSFERISSYAADIAEVVINRSE